ncbi:MAG: hypothetical protein QNL04_11050 [SAR324 cluster bacterium]|nr:hypothetical protein [SAR324 cluster bacterium]
MRNIKVRLLLLLIFLGFSANLSAQGLSWEAKTRGFTQYNPFLLEVVYIGAPEKLPPLITPDHLGKAFHLIEVKAISNEAFDGHIRRVLRYKILPLQAGKHILQPLRQGQLATKALEILVSKAAFEIKPPSLQPPPAAAFIWWPLFIAAGLIPFVYWLFSREKKAKQIQIKVASPKEQALAEIERLRESDLIATHNWDAFYSQLSWIFREYIEKSGFSHALGKTTAEFLKEAQKQNLFTPEEREGLTHFLSFSDLVKFAQAKAGEVSASQALDEVLSYITKEKDGV